MKPALVRVLALAATVAVVLSCDSAPPTSVRVNHNPGGKDVTPPSLSIDTPATGSLVNIGDSILVSMHLHDDQQLGAMVLTGVTETGSISLGTFQRTPRYSEIDVGPFRTGLRDTVIRRFLQPAQPVDTTVDSLVIVAVAKDGAANVDSALRRGNIVAGPRLSITSPNQGDTVPAGAAVTARAHAGRGTAGS